MNDPNGLAGQGRRYLERLGIVEMEQIRLTIVIELYMREMSIGQFHDTIGGSSYASVRRHFHKLVEHGWVRWVRNVETSRGRPVGLYRSTAIPVIDTQAFGTVPVSIRDALSVQLLEGTAVRLGSSLEQGVADRSDQVAAFETISGLNERDWCRALAAVERCFQVLHQEQQDAKVRLRNSGEEPVPLVVSLAAFEAPDQTSEFDLKAGDALLSARPPKRVGPVLADRLNMAIIDELNRTAMTPAQLRARLGGSTSQQLLLRRCKRLAALGLAVNVGAETGGPLHGANVYRFQAATPNVSKCDIFEKIPAAVRKGPSWEAFYPFIATALSAVEAGTFNRRADRHLTMSPLLVDEIGRVQIAKELQTVSKTVRELAAEVKRRRRGEGPDSFRAAFLMASFQTPVRGASTLNR